MYCLFFYCFGYKGKGGEGTEDLIKEMNRGGGGGLNKFLAPKGGGGANI